MSAKQAVLATLAPAMIFFGMLTLIGRLKARYA